MKYLILFTALYLLFGGIYFLRDFNSEFVVYIGVIVAIFTGVLLTLRTTKFPVWMLWLLSLWGLMHVLGGLVQTPDGVLFAYRIYPFFDGGGEFYILKYDQVVHGYLYGLVAVMAYHVIRNIFGATGYHTLVFLASVLISVGVSGMNEIMEFFITVTFPDNGVGGYHNTMLDMVFNFSGACVATLVYILSTKNSK